jgi:hypothetical protein
MNKQDKPSPWKSKLGASLLKKMMYKREMSPAEKSLLDKIKAKNSN